MWSWVGLQPLPLLARDARIAQYPREQTRANVSLVRIRQNNPFAISAHKFMLSAGVWPCGPQLAEIANQIATLDGCDRRQLYGRFRANIDVDSIDYGNRIVPG